MAGNSLLQIIEQGAPQRRSFPGRCCLQKMAADSIAALDISYEISPFQMKCLLYHQWFIDSRAAISVYHQLCLLRINGLAT
jgi:hypothetical protein